MDIYLILERDSANSYANKVKLEVVGIEGQAPSILFTLEGPNREFQIDMRKLKKALAALEDDS